MIRVLEKKIIFPGSFIKNTLDEIQMKGIGDEIINLTTNSLQRISMAYGSNLEASEFDNLLHIIFCYGNAGSLVDSSFEFEFFKNLGFNTWIPEYIGYGLSSGIANEKGCVETIYTVYDYLINVKKINPKNIIVSGHSLGAAVALHLASTQQIGGLILFSPFTSILQMAQTISLFRLLPINFIIETRFDNLSKIGKVDSPFLIAHGTFDEVIPYSMGRKLFEKSESTEKCFVSIEGAGHNDLFSFGSPLLISEILKFGHKVKNHSQ